MRTMVSTDHFVRLLFLFPSRTGWEGPSVLYFGDSVWADLVEARKLHGWTTGAIIYDVELELEKMSSPVTNRFRVLDSARLEHALRSDYGSMHSGTLRASACDPIRSGRPGLLRYRAKNISRFGG